LRWRDFMNRRELVIFLGFSTLGQPLTALAQEARKVRRIGFLRVGPPPPSYIGGFREGLRERGLIEGEHLVIDFALAPSATQISQAAAELVSRKPDVIVAAGTPSVFPARDAAGRIPVVFVATFDPVAAGLVASLARPGGNVTGMTTISGDLVAKRLQMTKELLPNLAKVAILVRDSSPTTPQYLEESSSAARNLGLELQVLTEHHPDDLERLLAAARGADALVVGDDTEFTTHRARIAELAVRNKLPNVHGLREMVEAGGMMSYGASFHDLYRRAASQVDKVLQGIKPGDLPIEQPVKFEFVLNIRTAKALGLTIPPLVLSTVDEVIE
jgi:putative tryptophan/tyrosine transport system substrate-binding protein